MTRGDVRKREKKCKGREKGCKINKEGIQRIKRENEKDLRSGRQAAQYALRRSWGRDTEGERSGTCGRAQKSDNRKTIIGWSCALGDLGDPDASGSLESSQNGARTGQGAVACCSAHWGKPNTLS